MDIPLTVLIGIITGLMGAFFGYKGHERGQRGELRNEGQTTGTILTELGYIKSSLDDIKREQREQTRMNMEFSERLSSVEASARQAHKRLDEHVKTHNGGTHNE